MSSVADVLETPPSPPEPEPAGRLGFLRKNVWALGDQILISGTNFVTGVLTARALQPDEFGTFSIIFAALLLANILQSTLVTQPHNVMGTTRRGRAYRRYTSSTAVGQLLICGAELAVVIPLAVIAFAQGWSAAPMLLALIPAILCWQLQEFVRRVFYTEQRHLRAFANDLIGYGGLTVLLAALYVGNRTYGLPFTGAMALYALAATSALAALVGLYHLRRSLVRRFDVRDLRENWHFGKWLAGGELMGWCSSVHMQVWWAAILIGTWASADLRAAQILFGPTRVIAFFLGTILPIRFARALHADGPGALSGQLRRVYLGLIPVVGTYCLLLGLFPEPLLHLVYGAEYRDEGAARVLSLYAISAFLSYMQMVIAAALTASRQTRSIFNGSLWGAIMALILSPICILAFGAPGAIVSIMLTTLVVTTMYSWAYRRTTREGEGRGFEVVPAAGGEAL